MIMEEGVIIEYCNPCFPDVPYYKCTINNQTYHSKHLDRVINFKEDYISNLEYYLWLEDMETKASETFMKDVKIKD